MIEVDGNTHAEAEARDNRRTALIMRDGFRVIRYANDDVMRNLDGVIADITIAITKKGSAA